MTDPKTPSLHLALAQVLPSGHRFTYHHVSTVPTQCPPIFAAPPGKKPERTYRESHYLSLSIDAGSPGSTDSSNRVVVLGIEVFVFTTRRLTTVFVSKADSSGFIQLLNLPRTVASPLRSVCSAFISWIVRRRRRPGLKSVLTLFARAADQYLFPGSSENPSKHVSDDRQLVKWWCRVLQPVVQGHITGIGKEPAPLSCQAYITVPGEESITSFLPDDVKYNPALRSRWKLGHPLLDLAASPSAPPRCLIPRFPDDPKARFLDELDDELRDAPSGAGHLSESPSKRGSGQWRSVKTLDQFWELMAYRQECSSGRLVGFIWAVFPAHGGEDLQHSASEFDTAADSASQSTVLSEDTIEDGLSTPTPLSLQAKSLHASQPSLGPSPVKRNAAQIMRRKHLTGSIVPRLPRIKSSTSTSAAPSQVMPEESVYYYWPSDSRGQLLLEEKEYCKAIDLLLKLDFCSLPIAQKSTRTWIEEIALLAAKEKDKDWGVVIVGTAPIPVHHEGKADARDTLPFAGTGATLLVRKKTKPQPDASASSVTSSDVTPSGIQSLAPHAHVASRGTNILLGGKKFASHASVVASGLDGPVLADNSDTASAVGERKRKTIGSESTTGPAVPKDAYGSDAANSVNILGGTLVRKKPKVQ